MVPRSTSTCPQVVGEPVHKRLALAITLDESEVRARELSVRTSQLVRRRCDRRFELASVIAQLVLAVDQLVRTAVIREPLDEHEQQCRNQHAALSKARGRGHRAEQQHDHEEREHARLPRVTAAQVERTHRAATIRLGPDVTTKQTLAVDRHR